MQNIAYIMALSKIKGLGKKTLQTIVNDVFQLSDFDNVYLLLEQLCSKYKRIQKIDKDQFERLFSDSMKTLEQQTILGIKTIKMGDVDYPNSFYNLEQPPLYFFLKGDIDALNKDGIAVIGTRHVSAHGRKVGEHLGKYLAGKNWSVISGLADGCDTSGHVGCLQGNGITIAIVGTPLDQVYPKSNEHLQEKILANNGCVISEYPIGAATSPYNFIERDRLQCGLAKGLIVVETGLKGGSYHAINGAFSLNKPVACYQFNESHYASYPNSLGNQKMIIEGKAIPLYDAYSIDCFLNKCSDLARPTDSNTRFEMIPLFN